MKTLDNALMKELVAPRMQNLQLHLGTPMALLPLLLLLLACSPTFARSSTNYSTDLSALLAFKSQITSDPQNILSATWNLNSSFCNWFGVSCSKRRQRVTALELNNCYLGGTIAPHIGNLSFLSVLDLSNNTLTGQLPDALGQLRRLKILLLNQNSLSGHIPASISNISSLELFTLWNNTMSGSIPVGTFKNLKILSFSYNQLVGAIPAELGYCYNLEMLHLGGNNLTGVIPPSLGNLTRLTQLELSVNNLQGSIPPEIGSLINLQWLNLGTNGLTGALPSTIFNLTQLQMLSVATNLLTGSIPVTDNEWLPGIQRLYLMDNQFEGPIPRSLSRCKNVQLVVLWKNRFTGVVPPELGELPNITSLLLNDNNLTGTIPPTLGNLTTLEFLALSSNNLHGTIPNELGRLHKLWYFSLGQNGGLVGELPTSIYNISSLQIFDLSLNMLSGHLPKDFGVNLPNLQRLHLGVNQLTGQIPSSLFNSSMLTVIDMSQNSFSGSVPASVGNLSLLKILNIRFNKLSGGFELISHLTNCRHLEVLRIGSNGFNDFLPSSIGNLSTGLRVLEISRCRARGKIPATLGNLSSLISLDLRGNELSGVLPPSVTMLESLQQLYLQNNRLEGAIPYELYRLRQLGELYLQENMFSGSIPNFFRNVTGLRVVSLAANALSSAIPHTMWSLTDLLTLNLSHNSLVGLLPEEVGNLKSVQLIDLSRNRLSGELPGTIGGLQMLSVLDLSNNSFTGPIPESVGGLISIDIMDLSFNALSGMIPKPFSVLRYLQNLNLSYNSLEGEIPNGGVFENLTAQSFIGNLALCGASKFGVPHCATKAGPKSRNRLQILKYILPPIAVIIGFLACLFILLRCKTRKRDAITIVTADQSPGRTHKIISYHEIVQATNNFDEANLLGVGSFGSVYKGQFVDGSVAAVKVLNMQLEKAPKSFDVECSVLSTVRHRNLVKIISTCSNFDFKALVMQFMQNGSLERWLYSQNGYLDLVKRVDIMLDVAFALEYLHHHSPRPVVHCDLKPSNVLLDEDMTARLCDFGIAKLLAGDDTSTVLTAAPGTVGYMAPEYGQAGRVSTRADVYSFGILLLEIITRKKPTDEIFVGELTLRGWVCAHVPNVIEKVVDGYLLESEEEQSGIYDNEMDVEHPTAKYQCLLSLLDLGLVCSMESPKERVSMEDVVVKLKKIKTGLNSSPLTGAKVM